MILRITDGTTTINLVGSAGDGIYGGAEYAPRTPEVSETTFTAEALRDGGELLEATRRNVVESVRLVVTGASRSALQTSVQSIEKLLESATQRQRQGVGDRVYVEYRKADSGDVYRSEILTGRLELSEETAGEAWHEAGAIAVTLAWQRRFYWEGPESELSLSNSHGTGTGGVTVYNHDDGSQDNYVAISSADVGGVIPAACRIEIENTYNVSERLEDLIIGHNVFSNPGSLVHFLEGEDASYNAGGASALPASPDTATYSNGQYLSATWGGDSEYVIFRWALSTTLLNACAGGWFRLWARITNAGASGAKITPKITFPSGTPLTQVAEGAEVTLDSQELQDLGVLQIPPWLRGETGLYALDLTLYGRKTGGATVDVDFVQLTPLDSYRYLYPRGYGAAYSVTIVDDGIDGVLYTTGWGGAYKTGHYLGRGDSIMLWPGRDQRLYILATNNDNDAEVARTNSIRVYYRPRRLTL